VVEPFSLEDCLILVVDDVPNNLKIVGEMLDQAGYATTFATSALQAIDRVKTIQPDLILLDLMMPEMNGLEACEILKLDLACQDIPIIFLTASNECEHLLQAFNHGAVDYITKPFYKPELLARVKTHLMLKHTTYALKGALAEMERLAKTDALTGVLNRRNLFEVAERELDRARRYGCAFSILMLDIDHFKHINDTYGHLIGDMVLQQLAATIRDALRKVDELGRYGGEEFAVILPETGIQQAIDVAERIQELIAKLVLLVEDGPVCITVSIGIATYEATDQTLYPLFERADKALYQAKQSGRNTYCVMTADSSANSKMPEITTLYV
jgi:diguanylate cyclase (GGDEF)-like protein